MADTYQMFVGGEWVNSASGQTRSITSPATGEVLAEVQEGSAEDVDRAVSAARSAFDEAWQDSTPGERQAALLKLAERGEPPKAAWGLSIVGPAKGIFSRYPPLEERVHRLLLLSDLLDIRKAHSGNV